MYRDGRHHEVPVEEWVFAAWTADARLGLISGHRIVGRTAWYWAALAREGCALLHITDFEVPLRADPFIVKGEALWAEHHCDAEMEQWSVGNETYASKISDPDEALGRGYGDPTPIAFDLEWYATAVASELATTGTVASELETGPVDGYVQDGVVHGVIDILDEPGIELVEVPARRWHRWVGPTTEPGSANVALAPLALREVTVHTGVRAPFAFPDGTVSDLVLTPSGWALRGRSRRGR